MSWCSISRRWARFSGPATRMHEEDKPIVSTNYASTVRSHARLQLYSQVVRHWVVSYDDLSYHRRSAAVDG
jgi:hypothetical protein